MFVQGFLERHGFPTGPLLLTDWGPGAAGLLRIDTRTHKMAALRELPELLPEVPFVLVGDSAEMLQHAQDHGLARLTGVRFPGTTGRDTAQTCRPHSVLADPAQRPALASSPGATRRVQGAQPIEG